MLVDQIGIYVLLAVGLNVVVGFAGLLDLGYIAFFAIGAYATAYFTDKLPVHPPITLNPFFIFPIAVIAAMLAGPHPRRAHAAAARRLPRDRDPRLRRDRPDPRRQQRLA